MGFPTRIARTDEGGIRLLIPEPERELLRRVALDLGSLLEQDADDPALERLFPPARPAPERQDEGARDAVRDDRS